MGFNFSFYLREMQRRYRKNGKKPNQMEIVDLLLDLIALPLGLKNEVGDAFNSTSSSASLFFTEQADPQDDIIEGAKRIGLETIVASFKPEVLKHIEASEQKRMVDMLWREINVCYGISDEEKTTLSKWKEEERYAEFLSKAFLLSLFQPNKSRKYPKNNQPKQGRPKHTTDTQVNGDYFHKASSLNEIVFQKSTDLLAKQKHYEILDDLVPEFDKPPTKYSIVVGEGGAGKSTWLYSQWSKLLSQKLLPVYVPLNNFDGNRNFIKEYILTHYTDAGLSLEKRSQTWGELVHAHSLHLLLDGLNEATNSERLGAEIEELQSNGLSIWITTRNDVDWYHLKGFEKLHMRPLAEDVVQNVLTKHKIDAPATVEGMLTNPFFLTLFLGINDAIRVESKGELLLAHHNKTKAAFNKDTHGKAFYRIAIHSFDVVLPQLAFFADGVRFPSSLVDSILAPSPTVTATEVLSVLADAGMILEDGYNRALQSDMYFFSHEIFKDFYGAYYIFQVMQEEKLCKELTQGLLSRNVTLFLGDLLGKSTSPIEKYWKKHLKGKEGPDAQAAVHNLFEVMRLSRGGAMQGTCFDGLDLRQCSASDTVLVGSSFRSTKLLDSFFLPVGHRGITSSVVLDQSNRFVLTSSFDEKTFYLWDIQKQNACKRFDCSQTPISVGISPNRRYVLGWYNSPVPTVEIFPVDCPQSMSDVTMDGDLLLARFDKYGNIVAVTEGGVFLYDVTGNQICSEIASVTAAAFYKERNAIVAFISPGTIQLWNVTETKFIPEPKRALPQSINCIRSMASWTHQGDEYVVLQTPSELIYFTLDDVNNSVMRPQQIGFWKVFGAGPNAITVSPSAPTALMTWNVKENKIKYHDVPLDDSVITAFDISGKAMAVADQRNEIHILDASCTCQQSFFAGYQYWDTGYVCQYSPVAGTEYAVCRKTANFLEILRLERNHVERISLENLVDMSFANPYVFLCYRADSEESSVNDQYFLKIVDLSVSEEDFPDIPVRPSIDKVFPTVHGVVVMDYESSSARIYSKDGGCEYSVSREGRWDEYVSSGDPTYKIDTEKSDNYSFWGSVRAFAAPFDGNEEETDGLQSEDPTYEINAPNNDAFWGSIRDIAVPTKQLRNVHALLPYYQMIVSGTLQGELKGWSIHTTEKTLDLPLANAPITAIKPIHNTPFIVVQTSEKTLIVFDVVSKIIVDTYEDRDGTFDQAYFINYIPLEKDSQAKGVCEYEKEVLVLKLAHGSLIAFSKYNANRMAVSRKKNRIAIISSGISNSQATALSVTENGSLEKTLDKEYPFRIEHITLSDGGEKLIVSTPECPYIIDVATGAIEFFWTRLSADIFGCRFFNVSMSEKVKVLLQQNGAVFEE